MSLLFYRSEGTTAEVGLFYARKSWLSIRLFVQVRLVPGILSKCCKRLELLFSWSHVLSYNYIISSRYNYLFESLKSQYRLYLQSRNCVLIQSKALAIVVVYFSP